MTEILKTLALQFFSFTEERRVRRTTQFMDYGDELKVIRDEIEEVLKIIQSGEGFSVLVNTRTKSPERIRDYVNKWSCEATFKETFLEATHKISCYEYGHNKSRSQHEKPNVAAAAWIEYFAEWDEKNEAWVGNENWKKYYYENYPGELPEKK